MRKITPRRLIAAGSAVLLVSVALATVLPAGADVPSAVRLHLGSDRDYFAYGSDPDDYQYLTTPKNGCQINSAETIIDLASAPTPSSSPGLVTDGIGVKTSKSSSNGTPCSQVESSSSETLTLSAKAGGQLGSRRFIGVSLDLEITGNAMAKLDFTPAGGGAVVTYTLQTGTGITAAQMAEPDYDLSAPYDVTTDVTLPRDADRTDACAAPNSSGPNSGDSDNCRWTVYPGFEFSTFTLRSTTAPGSSPSGASVSLEGGGDFAGDPTRDTLLHLANSAPTAAADSYTTNEDTQLTGNVLTNDSDPEGDPLTATKLTDPSHGTLGFDADGSFTYQPAPNYNGSDSFTYTSSDGAIASGPITVSITITPVNDAPVAANDLENVAATTNEDTRVNNVPVATDPEDDAMISDCTSTPPGATFEDNGDGTVDVSPPANFFGSLRITCTVRDIHGAESEASATILVGVTSVNDVPVANPDADDVDQDRSAVSDTSVDINVLANDADVETDELALAIVDIVVPSADAAAGASATVVPGTLSDPGAKIRYTPREGFVGTATFTYKVSDGQATSAPATVTVEVVRVMCSLDPVGDADGLVSGSFFRLSDPEPCKRYTVDANVADGTVLFAPSGDVTVSYRGFVSLGPDAAPVVGGTGEHQLRLRYDQDGDLTVGPGPRPVPWCQDAEFDEDGVVTSAVLPGAGHTWCIASERTVAVGPLPPELLLPQLVTTWQVYGEDDPRFTR